MVMTTRRNLNADLTQAVGAGMCCAWTPGRTPGALALVMERIDELDVSDALEAMGYDQSVTVEQEPCGSRRRMELLGPDSPGEFVYEFQPVERGQFGEQAKLAAEMAVWIYERGPNPHLESEV